MYVNRLFLIVRAMNFSHRALNTGSCTSINYKML